MYLAEVEAFLMEDTFLANTATKAVTYTDNLQIVSTATIVASFIRS